MRIPTILALSSAVLLAGCQSSHRSDDWVRAAKAAGRTVLVGGGFFLGGPIGAAAGATLGAGLLDDDDAAAVAVAAPGRAAPRSYQVARRATARSAAAPQDTAPSTKPAAAAAPPQDTASPAKPFPAAGDLVAPAPAVPVSASRKFIDT